jgi:hypothetical protein
MKSTEVIDIVTLLVFIAFPLSTGDCPLAGEDDGHAGWMDVVEAELVDESVDGARRSIIWQDAMYA